MSEEPTDEQKEFYLANNPPDIEQKQKWAKQNKEQEQEGDELLQQGLTNSLFPDKSISIADGNCEAKQQKQKEKDKQHTKAELVLEVVKPYYEGKLFLDEYQEAHDATHIDGRFKALLPANANSSMAAIVLDIKIKPREM